MLGMCVLWAVWNHARHSTVLVRYYSTGVVGCFALSGVGEILQVLWTHKFFYRGLPRARAVRIQDAVCLVVCTPTPLAVRPGQYVNVCIPGVSFWSFLQSHPFYVSFAREYGGGTMLELMVEPRRGDGETLDACPTSRSESGPRISR